MPVPGPALDFALSAVSSPSGTAWVQRYPCTVRLKQEDSNRAVASAADAIVALLGVWKPLQEGLSQAVEATGSGEAESLALHGCESAVPTGIGEADLTETPGEGG